MPRTSFDLCSLICIYGASVRASAKRAPEARRTADQLACEAWNKRMLAFQGPLQQLKGRPPISSSAPCLMMPCSKALGSSSSAA
jgi:hypothetical protein